jgi:hypothetical protein
MLPYEIDETPRKKTTAGAVTSLQNAAFHVLLKVTYRVEQA